MRYLNGFILTGAALLVISIAGLVGGERVLTEPGQPANPLAWLWYLAAAGIMIVNGIVSIRTVPKHQSKPAQAEPAQDDEAEA